VLDLARVGDGTRLIEIGCGWGSLAIRAAQRGATVVGLTLSVEQQQLARRRIADAGVADRVQILLQDYRVHAAGHRGAYTAAASVEMIENVGKAFWPAYFTSVAQMLEPGARFGLQSITMSHDRLLATHRNYSWIGKYIFPGGRIPSVTAIEQNLAAHTGLRVLESRTLGRFYGPTLRNWRHAFADALPRVAELGFDETFMRMWTFYLAYSEAGFEAGYLDDYQLGIG
jgi:cyclopropane-fatty-acyl-phospholipid synthase